MDVMLDVNASTSRIVHVFHSFMKINIEFWDMALHLVTIYVFHY